MAPKTLVMESVITWDEIQYQMQWQDHKDVHDFIVELDLQIAETEFTIDLIKGLIKSLEDNGMKVKFKVKDADGTE